MSLKRGFPLDCFITKGAFTNYVDKRRRVGSPKFQLFVNVYKVEIVNGGG